jgi:Zn-dependent M32 family carboxypeptidase
MVKVEIELEKLNEYIEKAEKYEETARQSQQYRNWWQGAEAILETKKREIKEKNQENENLEKRLKETQELHVNTREELQEIIREQIKEIETLKKQLEEKENKPDKYPYPSPIPEKTEKDICPDSETIINPIISCGGSTLHFLTEKEIEEIWKKCKQPNAVDDFGNILILSIQ